VDLPRVSGIVARKIAMAHQSKFFGVVVALLAALGAAGCADEQEPLIVLNATSFTDGECEKYHIQQQAGSH
jgi:hypothetical protein